MAPGTFGLLTLTGLILISTMGVPPAQGKTDKAYQLQKVKEWRAAATEHESGKSDPAAVTIAGWPSYDVDSVIQFVNEFGAQPAGSAKRNLAKGINRRALDLTEQEVIKGDLIRVLREGVLLHTDIALLQLGKAEYQYRPEGVEGVGIFVDGRVIFQPQHLHWRFARQLIELLSKVSSQEPAVRQWYIATTALMQSRRMLGYAGQNLKSALIRFPSDDKLLFYSGVLHETWASPLNQNPILPQGVKISYGFTESELRSAQEDFQKVVKKKPGFAEAHLRLGRVMTLLGNHTQAITELQNAAAAIHDRQLSYYASLFLGFECGMRALRSEAQKHYERAAALYPDAQSPLLAISQLELDGGDVENALAALKRVFALPRKDRSDDDPWWVYDLAHVRDAGILIDEMRKTFGELPQ